MFRAPRTHVVGQKLDQGSDRLPITCSKIRESTALTVLPSQYGNIMRVIEHAGSST